MKNLLFVTTLIVLFLISCKKDKDIVTAPQYSFSATTDTITAIINQPLQINANQTSPSDAISNWLLNDVSISETATFNHSFDVAGFFTVTFKATNEAGSFEKKFIVNVEPVIRTGGSSQYISNIYEYLPAPGQFINVAPGNPASAEGIVGKANGLVTLGAYGGYIIFGFDHSVENKAGFDIAIYGNPIAPVTEWSEPGIVMVSRDDNGNGLPDDTWYELAGSEYNSSETIKNYSVTYYNPKTYANVPWKDNQGNTGAVEVNAFHKQQYYPLFATNQDSLVFTGTLLKNTFNKVGSTYVNNSFSWGYADSYSSGDDYATNKYNSFDITWAVDNNGKPVTLKAIDFVKVYTAQNDKGNALLGEVSTELKGAEDLHFEK